MTRWALLLEYDGSPFVGWQHQATGASVQSVLEHAVAQLAGRPVTSVAAGRTDSGVHALAQVAHVDLDRPMTPARMVAAVNFHLKPHPVAVLRAAVVDASFSARFSAIGRAYRYDILNRPARAALQSRRVWHIPAELDVAAMHAGAQTLLGRHDFSSFRASACQANSPLRTLDRLDVARCGELVQIVAEARSFLHHQVRNMVGTLRLVGEGRWAPADMARVLVARDRTAAGPTAPPDGLFMTGVRYPDDLFRQNHSL